jgi:putative transposase
VSLVPLAVEAFRARRSRGPAAIFGEWHLRQVLAVYAAHYNGWRPHWALRLRAPRPTSPVPEPIHGRARRRPILGGLLNEYDAAA